MRYTLIVGIQMVAMLAWPASVGGQQPPEKPIEDCVDVRLRSVRPRSNVLSAEGHRKQPLETLVLEFSVDIRDPNRIVGTSGHGVVTGLANARGRSVAPNPGLAPARLSYTPLRFLYLRIFYQAPLPRWRRILRSILRMPPRRPEFIRCLDGRPLSLEVEKGPLELAGREIGRLEGYFYALSAESIEYVEVPFEPNSSWVRLTPDDEIRVADAHSAGATFRWAIDWRHQGAPSQPLAIDAPLSTRLLLAQEFIGADGRVVYPANNSSYTQEYSITASGSAGGGNLPVKTIRYVIAVNPRHEKIPFVFEHVPLSK